MRSCIFFSSSACIHPLSFHYASLSRSLSLLETLFRLFLSSPVSDVTIATPSISCVERLVHLSDFASFLISFISPGLSSNISDRIGRQLKNSANHTQDEEKNKK